MRRILDAPPSKPSIQVGINHARYNSVDSRRQF
jgi:hypothetical protein